MFKLLKALIYEKTNAFVAGSIGGSFLSFKLFIADISFKADIAVFCMKVGGAVAIAFCTGIASALGKEYVDYRKQKKKERLKREAEQKIKDDYKQIWGKNGTHN